MSNRILTNRMWKKLAPLLPPEGGQRGPVRKSNRRMVEAMLWKLRTGAPWRDLPHGFGPWDGVYSRFKRWCLRGVWQTVLEFVRQETDLDLVMVDSTMIKAHQHASGQRGGSRRRPSAARGAGSRPSST